VRPGLAAVLGVRSDDGDAGVVAEGDVGCPVHPQRAARNVALAARAIEAQVAQVELD
jgi:hypothetical protein